MSEGATRLPALLDRLRDVTQLLASESEPRAVVGRILDQAIALVGAERGFVIRLGDAGAVEVAAARNVDREHVTSPEFEFSHKLARRVAATGRGELARDAGAEPATQIHTSVRKLKLRSILCVPLRAHGRTLGVVYVDHRYVKGRFADDELKALELFAGAAAIALDASERMDVMRASQAKIAQQRDELSQRVETIERLRAELAERYRESARETRRVRGRLDAREVEPPSAPRGLVARSSAMHRLLELARKVAASDAPVLILGESGTGKELLARFVHASSPRRAQPFVAENCAALADPLLESELFGHEEGAFTGASRGHTGLFEAARGGTLFLDEVGDMSPSLQSKLLRVLQEGEVRRVGGEHKIAVDARVVAATHRDLEALVARGEFRADLYYRLNVVRLEIPPLRERQEDVPALIDHFLESVSASTGARVELEPQARELLLSHDWPGNVRELENEIRRASILAADGPIRPGLLSRAIVGAGARPPASPSRSDTAETPIVGIWPLEELEREMIRRALKKAGGKKAVAARLLGMPKSSLYRRLEVLGLHVTTRDDDEA